jgi:UDP-N-acetylmuramate dehydrogenase
VPSSNPSIVVREYVALREMSTLGTGGPARWFTRAGSVDEVRAAHDWSRMRGVPLFVLGGGSNVVIADGGFGGLVLQMAIAGVTVAEGPDGTIVTSGAGEPWDGLVESVVGALVDALGESHATWLRIE